MKLSFFIMFVCAFHLFPTTSEAQNAIIELRTSQLSIGELFREIEKQTEYLVVYSDGEVDSNLELRFKKTKAKVSDYLDEALSGRNLKYEFANNYIVLSNTEKNQLTQQNKTRITGVVLDQKGEPVIGANIVEKGSTNGVISDFDGKFSIEVFHEKTLLISYIGYLARQIEVGNTTFLTIKLNEDTQNLEEVVVVGFGTQKKINLTGSVSSVSAKELEERPQPNVQNMLQGKVPGLQIVSNSAQPGRDGGNVSIRGKGSFGASSDPLILVDGIVGSLSVLAPDDIESVSILKDAASAAIYGARAANGVILVTTKKGMSGKAQVSYSFNYGWQQATKLSDQVWDSSTYMDMYNQMADRMGGKVKYPQKTIDKYSDPNRDMNLYPDYNWMEESFKTGSNMTHNLSVSGGNEKVTYNVSLGHLKQEGLLPGHDYKRYTGLMNLEAQVHERIKVGATSNFYNGKLDEPFYTNDGLVLMVLQSRPMTKPYLPDGSGRYSYLNMPENLGGEWLNRNPIWAMNETSRKVENWIANAQLYTIVDFIKKDNMKLDWTMKGGFRYADQFLNTHYPANPEGYYYLKESDYMQGGTNEHLYATNFFPEKRVENRDQREFYRMFYTTLGYSWDITDDHALGALAGFQEEAQSTRLLYGKRENYPSDSMTEIDGGSTSGQSLSGGISEYTLRSLFGRVNYAYKGRYLLEANFRYDGTSRIYMDNRWGMFPSLSGAWRVSEEKFIKENLPWVDNLKIRASWGQLGNSEINNYPYQDVYSTASYIFDGTVMQGAVQNALKDKSLKWESTTVTDLGLDLSLGNGLFTTTLDWYDKITDGILSQASIPLSVGMDAPTINYGKLRNRGIEFEVAHQNRIGEVSYGANFMASFNKNEVLQLRAPAYNSYIYEVGKPYGEHYLYLWDGIFQSKEDIENSPAHPNSPQPGDIKFKDINEDGVIDGKDRTMVEGVYPKMLYSFNFNIGYKDFDLSLFFQGVSGRKIWTDFFGEAPFAQGAAPSKKFLNAWTPQNTNTNVPALYTHGYAPMTGLRSTYNLKDASYLRLKNIQFGYNVPKTVLAKVGVQFLRVYFSGENLFTFTGYPDFDPERGGDGWHAQYPHAKTFSLGLNLKF